MRAGLSQLGNHAEVVMLDLAASLLGKLEKWVSSASTVTMMMSSMSCCALVATLTADDCMQA